MRRPLVIKLLAGAVLLLAIAYAVVRLDNWMAIRSIDLAPPEAPPPETGANQPVDTPVSEPQP